MLLQELVGVKSHKGKSAASLLAMLKKNYGITIHHGLYGVVLMHPSWDHVLKFVAKDDAYIKFVNLVMSDPNPHFPKFKKRPTQLSVFFKDSYGTKITHWNGEEYNEIKKIYVIKVEKLTPIDSENWNICRYIIQSQFLKKYKDIIGTSNEDEFLRMQGCLKYKELCQAIFEVQEKTPHDAFADLHDGNFMMRGDTIVITDPYAALDDHVGMEVTKIFSSEALTKLAGDELVKTVDSIADRFKSY